MTDLSIRVIDQGRRESGMEPLPLRHLRNLRPQEEVTAKPERDPRDLKLSAERRYYYDDDVR